MISVAAAVTAATLEAGLPEKTPVIRVMPNTPASVGEGMTAITAGRYADEDFIETAKEIFSALGKAAVVSERQLDEMGALSGAGPGYVFVIIDALADAGVRAGLRGSWQLKRRRRLCMAQPKWCWKQENIPPNSVTG